MLGAVRNVEAEHRNELLNLEKAPQAAFLPAITGIQQVRARRTLHLERKPRAGSHDRGLQHRRGFARTSTRVILVDASLETATLSDFAGLADQVKGFTNVIDEPSLCPAPSAPLNCDSEHNLDFLPAGIGEMPPGRAAAFRARPPSNAWSWSCVSAMSW